MRYESVFTNQFPAQKKTTTQKTEKWAKDCINAADNLALFRTPLIRQTYQNKIINYNLANDILNTKDVERVCNPFGFKGVDSDKAPAKMQNYPIAVPKIDLLVGEERKRRFHYTVRVINDEAVSKREQEKKEELKAFYDKLIAESENMTDSEINNKIKHFRNYLNYEWQDLRERSATHILNYLWKKDKLAEKFNRGFEDVLIASEEIFCVEIVANSPTLRKCNPLNVFTVRSGESPWVNDADIIIEDGYLSQGQIIDKYHEYLTDQQVKDLETGDLFSTENEFISIGEREPHIAVGEFSLDSEDIIAVDRRISSHFGGAYDDEGNIRVMRVVWKSKRKIGKLTYLDQDGDEVQEIVDEKYVKKEGDTIKWEWISEWWEGTRIGGGVNSTSDRGLYINIKRREIQYRSIHNISQCHSGYIGLAFNTNVSKAKSLMDRMKPYQYLYNVFMYRTELAFARAKGRIAKLDITKKPQGWKVEDWMYYAEVNGWLIENPFNEGNKGAATGKLSGQMSGAGTHIDLDLGNYIQYHINMLQFIENQLGQIAGVTRQREGQIENRETVRGVERAVSQSSHITEKWFQLHEQVKIEALTILLETAKHAWKGQKKILSYVTDEMTSMVYEIDGDELMECDYGLFLSNSSDDMELIQNLKELSHAGLQNDKLNFSQLMDIYTNPHIASIRRKIEAAEEEKVERDQRNAEQAQQLQTQKLQANSIEEDKKREFELNKINTEYDRKERLEALKHNLENNLNNEKDIDLDDDGIDDDVELKKAELKNSLEELKLKQEKLLKEKDLKHDADQREKDRKSKEKIASKKTSSNK